MELLTKLGVNGSLILGQILTFAILYYILQKFVFKPVFQLLEKRRRMIEQTAEHSQKAESLLADIEKTRFEAIEKIKLQSVEMLEKASAQAELVKAELIASAHKESELMFVQTKTQIEQLKKQMLKEIEQKVAALVVASVSKILDREFSDTDQKRLMQEAVAHIATNN